MWTRFDIPTDPSQPFTDFSRWRLRYSDAGDQTWHYLSPEESKKEPQPIVDKYWLGILKVRAHSRPFLRKKRTHLTTWHLFSTGHEKVTARKGRHLSCSQRVRVLQTHSSFDWPLARRIRGAVVPHGRSCHRLVRNWGRF